MKIGNRMFYSVMSMAGLLICLLLGWLRYRQYSSTGTVVFEQLSIYNDDHLLETEQINIPGKKAPDEVAGLQPSYAFFDPNTASVEALTTLGLTPAVARTIIRYREKGGRFFQPEDLRKIYTLSEADYTRLQPYIRIVAANRKEQEHTYSSYTPKTNHPIDMNTADTAVWRLQKGIGPAFAARIVSYRDKLGGFTSREQLQEVYGLPDSTYHNLLPYLRLSTTTIRKINVNKATEQELAAHPYINLRMATAIIRLRKDIGAYTQIEDLRMLPLINEENYRKIAQYLTVE